MNLQTGFTLFHMLCPTMRTSSAAAAEACNGVVVILLLFFFSVIGTLLCYCLHCCCCCCCEIGKTSENSFLYASLCRLWSLTNFRGKQRVKAAHCMCLCVCVCESLGVWVPMCMCVCFFQLFILWRCCLRHIL